MTISLCTIPDELKLRILHFAGWRAAVQLGATSKQFNDVCSEPTFWKRAVKETFRMRVDHFSKDGNWRGAFQTLASGRLYGWGQNWHLMFNSHEFNPKRSQKKHCHFPNEIADKQYQGVVDVQSGGWSVSLLTLSGAVVISGSLDGATAWAGYKPRTLNFSNADERITQISSGRCHLLALSDSGQIWSARGSGPTSQPALIQFMTPKGAVENPICTKVIAGWSASGALIQNHGLFLWFDQATHSQSRPISPYHENAVPPVREVDIKRIPYFVDIFEDVMDKDRVVDFAIGEHLVILVTSSGKVFALDIENQQEEIVPMQLVNIVAPKGSSKIDRVEGKFREFAVFNSDGLVHLLKDENIKAQFALLTPQPYSAIPEIRTSTVSPHSVEELKNYHIVDISFGDWHVLALTDTGKVLTWGRDSGSCGALGHGDQEAAEKIGVRYEYRDGILKKPTPVKFGEGEFYAYKVSAAGWRSCALVAEVNGQSALTAGGLIQKGERMEVGKGKGKEEQAEGYRQNGVSPPMERGHRGGIAGVPSDARGGSVSLSEVAMANRPNATSFFGLSPSNHLFAPQLNGAHIGGSGGNGQERNGNTGDE